jgi:hypothetical protein
MTSQKINILYLPYNNAGGHFIDWSILFVSGQDHYVTPMGSVVPLMLDPNTRHNRNLHAHQTTMAAGFDHLKQIIKTIQDSKVAVANIYCTRAMHNHILASTYGPECRMDSSTFEQREHANLLIKQDNLDMLCWIQQQKFPLMFIDYLPADIISIVYNDRFPAFNNKEMGTVDTLWSTINQTFFTQAEQSFGNEVWDQREKYALTLQPVAYEADLYQLIDQHRPHLYYNTDAIWNDMPNCLIEMCEFAGLPVDTARFELWQEHYRHWREKHDIGFARDFDRIIDCIVNNRWMSLTRYRLDFFKEVLIQQALIQKHNLNLRTWQLVKFPNNTQDLHKLLESNIHTV